jgi:hypothetical protein
MTERPWYRHFWLWIMLVPLIGSVIAGFVTLYLAGAPPALVVDDFGKIAMAVELDQQRDRHAAELGLGARLEFGDLLAGNGRTVSISLSGAAPDRLKLELIHPTLEHMDQRVLLKRIADAYTGSVVKPDTRLHVLLSDEQGSWRLTGTLAAGQDVLDLQAGPGQ